MYSKYVQNKFSNYILQKVLKKVFPYLYFLNFKNISINQFKEFIA